MNGSPMLWLMPDIARGNGISSGTENAARSAAALARKFIATCRCKWKAAM